MTEYSPPRRSPRLALFVDIEVVALPARERVSGFTGNVSSDGCYMRTSSPFATFTRVRVILKKAGQQFEASGAVVHAQPGQGMGIAFEEVTPQNRAILDAWLAAGAG